MFKKILLISFMFLFAPPAFTKEVKADKLFIVHFEVGSKWDKSLPPQQQTSFKEHSQNLNHLRKKKIISFGARYSEFGLIIIKAKSLNLAKSLIEKDPGVTAKIFTFKIEPLNVFYPWEN